jgi:hypothetical protein
MFVCLLAGCVVQPTSRDPSLEATPPRPLLAGRALASAPLCIGVEYLPPDASDARGDEGALGGLRVEALPQGEEPRRREAPQGPTRRPDRDRQHTWALSTEDLANIDDPVARETLRFVDDLLREDRRRAQEDVSVPFLEWQANQFDPGLQLTSEEAAAAEQAEWVHEHGPSLLKRPFRRLLRRLPLVRDVEVGFRDFRSDHVPLSEPYRETHRRHRGLGRISLRVHVDDFRDPVELSYVHSGVRIGSSQEVGKLGIDWALTDSLSLQVRARREYETRENDLRADLVLRASATTSLHFVVGDNLDFLTTSAVYSLCESPFDGSPGFLVYAQHVF